jgi:hypothetical protein
MKIATNALKWTIFIPGGAPRACRTSMKIATNALKWTIFIPGGAPRACRTFHLIDAAHPRYRFPHTRRFLEPGAMGSGMPRAHPFAFP